MLELFWFLRLTWMICRLAAKLGITEADIRECWWLDIILVKIRQP